MNKPRELVRCRRLGLQRRARASVLWCLALFAAFQAFYHYPLARLYPQLCDPEFGQVLVGLRARLAATSTPHPLVVAFGSSLTNMGLKPTALTACQPANPQGPLVYNFGINGCFIGVQLTCLKRLLADGIRPDCVLIEAYPRFYLAGSEKVEAQGFGVERFQRSDINAMVRYHDDNAHKLRAAWRDIQLVPWYHRRNVVQSLCLPTWVPKDKWQHRRIQFTDEWGWLMSRDYIETAKKEYHAADFARKTRERIALQVTQTLALSSWPHWKTWSTCAPGRTSKWW